ncbi:MAG: adenosylcobinamide-phosphate synthase CbiB [Candidatus Omnitrophota bacterium]|jgi:adenosylcobinamide-phosphate synthase
MLLLISAYLADLVFGDPEWLPHPVRWMGRMISVLEVNLRGGSVRAERLKGALLVVTVIGISAICSYLFIYLAGKINQLLGAAAWIYTAYTTIAVKDLLDRARTIMHQLNKGDIANARTELSGIVSRSTAELDEDKVTVSTIESLAENTSDGVIAPLFYLILGGPVLAIAYKSINTLDSMVGYKNEKYINLGWFSARLDDLANFIPARISGLLISVSSAILGRGFKAPFNMMLRDGRKHPSPNSGVPEAAMAGALGIRLGGSWVYDGKASDKPFLGDEARSVENGMISEASSICFVASFLMVSIGVVYKWLV